MVHIVFEQANTEVLSKAIELDERLQGDIIEIKDDFAVGPLQDIYGTEGYQQRRDWWKTLLEFSACTEQMNIVDDKLTVHNLLKRLDEEPEEKAWIWMGQNAHDVCGYYWLMSQCKEYHGRIEVLYLNNLPFFNEKGNIFYPTNLYEIQPKEFLKAKKLARPITLSEFEVDPDEWTKLCNEGKSVRLLEGGKKLIQADEDYYDAELKKYITTDWQKASKIIQQCLSKSKETTGDAYLLWRLKTMLSQGQFDVQGKLGKMKEFELKIPTVA